MSDELQIRSTLFTSAYVGGRQSGKTERMLFWLNLHPTGTLITFSYEEAKRIEAAYFNRFKRKLGPDRVMSINSEDAGKRRKGPIAVDNVELVFEALFNRPVDVLTASANRID